MVSRNMGLRGSRWQGGPACFKLGAQHKKLQKGTSIVNPALQLD